MRRRRHDCSGGGKSAAEAAWRRQRRHDDGRGGGAEATGSDLGYRECRFHGPTGYHVTVKMCTPPYAAPLVRVNGQAFDPTATFAVTSSESFGQESGEKWAKVKSVGMNE